jgi:peptide deformylase
MEIKIYGDSILRKKCLAVAKIGDEEKQIFDSMVKIMRQSGGVGLAACQVGFNKQMLVVDCQGKALRLANPKIYQKKGSFAIEEGCLSVPDIKVRVKRFKNIKLKALNEYNQRIVLNAEDLLAVVLQHEIDHLRGKLIIDYLPWYKKVKAIRLLKSKRNQNKSR